MPLKYLLIVLSAIVIVTSCNTDKNRGAYTKDEDYKEYSRTYSPNKSMVLLDYASHKGPFDYSIRGTAIINVKDTAGNLIPYTLNRNLTNARWSSDTSVTAQYDLLPAIRKGAKITVRDTIVNGVSVSVVPNDYIGEDAKLNVLHNELSPDRKYKMVVYRYDSQAKHGFIHLSVIPVNAVFPKYGNYFIANLQADYIYYARWSTKNQLILFTDNVGKDLIYYGLVKNRPSIGYQIVADDDRYKNVYRWQGK
jgi:hypothetical protein